jgi:hypothetical protein
MGLHDGHLDALEGYIAADLGERTGQSQSSAQAGS